MMLLVSSRREKKWGGMRKESVEQSANKEIIN